MPFVPWKFMTRGQKARSGGGRRTFRRTTYRKSYSPSRKFSRRY